MAAEEEPWKLTENVKALEEPLLSQSALDPMIPPPLEQSTHPRGRTPYAQLVFASLLRPQIGQTAHPFPPAFLRAGARLIYYQPAANVLETSTTLAC